MKELPFCIGLLSPSFQILFCILVNSSSTFNYLNTLLIFETWNSNYFSPDGKEITPYSPGGGAKSKRSRFWSFILFWENAWISIMHLCQIASRNIEEFYYAVSVRTGKYTYHIWQPRHNYLIVVKSELPQTYVFCHLEAVNVGI